MDVTLSPRARGTVAWTGVALAILIFYLAWHALSPFIWAVITAYLFHPIVAAIQRKTRLPKQIVALWFYLLLGLLLAIVFINVTPLLVVQLEQVQQQLIPDVLSDIDSWVEERQRVDQRFSIIDTQIIQDRIDLLGQQLTDLIGTEAVPLLLETFSFAIELFIYLFSSFYLVVYGPRFLQFARDAINRRYHREYDRLMTDVNRTLGAYLRGQAILVIIMSTASYVALRVLDVDYALSVAIATGFLELIPLIGPWSAGAIAVTIALFQPTAPFDWSNTTLAIVIGFIYFALRQLEDAFVIPLVIGRFVHLNPFVVLFVLVIGTSVAGPLGLILSVPFAAVLKIVVQFFHAKLLAREVRIVEEIRSAVDLAQVASTFKDQANATIVLMIEPGALAWDNLPLVRRVAAEAEEHYIGLSVVTPDGIAGTLTTAAGIPTATVPTGSFAAASQIPAAT
ncbi:MAG: AI-2E family transporter [Chloroflexota bacterium]|nr:AI-2E family transporter [Chloroflexota bacterium]